MREVVAQPDAVVFVGAGVSVWSGLPTWSGLIAELADFLDSRDCVSRLVRRELAHGDLLQAASFAFDLLTPQDRATFLRQACRYGSAQPSALHRRLASLGPRAFITTNYDKLLEQALIAERPELSFQLVNNVNLVETATIVQSRARDFIFKPHGDIDTSDSIVLTREQYRVLRSEKRNAFEAFKTLLASRPILFVGFALRDPDFLLIKDTLATVYKGAAQDHFALVADVEDQEVEYWRKHYGIHLISYQTDASSTEVETRHGALLSLLDSIAVSQVSQLPRASASKVEVVSEEQATLAILRHARRILQLGPPPDTEILPLSASPYLRQDAKAPTWETRAPFLEGDVVNGLRHNQERVLLTGAPGAGKTFVVRAAVALLAEAVIDTALGTDTEHQESRVPAYIDLRDYSGNLWQMVVEGFPIGFPLDQLVEAGRISFFVDGLNEVSAKSVEDNTLHADLTLFLNRIGDCSAVLATRFGEEHTELSLPEIALEAIPRAYVWEQLMRREIPSTSISAELLKLLERPVFYRFCLEHDLWDARTPHSIYAAVLAGLDEHCRQRFGKNVDLIALFGRVAFESIEVGDQSIPVTALVEAAVEASSGELDANELINWLLSREMLVPRLGKHVSFFHHSFTEYVAAHHLVVRCRERPEELARLLKSRRWDHVVLLAIGFLSEAEQHAFFDEVLAVDAVLGLRALAFIEHDWKYWTSEALSHIQSLRPSWMEGLALADEVMSMRIDVQHEPLLLAIAQQSDQLGGAALAKTLDLGGKRRVQRAIHALFEHPDDYNRCSAIASKLGEMIDGEGNDLLLDRLASYPVDARDLERLTRGKEVNRLTGLLSASAEVLDRLPLVELQARFPQPTVAPPLIRSVILDLLEGDGSPEAIRLAAELLPSEPAQAAVTLHFQLAHRDDSPDIASLKPEQAGPMLLNAESTRNDGWALDTIRLLAAFSPAWSDWACTGAEQLQPTLVSALLWHAGHQPDQFFATLELLQANRVDWSAQPLTALNMTEITWSGHETLLLSLLRERHDKLALYLLETIRMWGVSDTVNPSLFDLGSISWWIDWLAEGGDESFFLHDRLGRFVAFAAGARQVRELLKIFETGTDAERRVLAYHVLGEVRDLKMVDLTPSMVDWALGDLARPVDTFNLERSVLGTLATEDFVERTLLPLMGKSTQPQRSNLQVLIQRAGERHRRRYLRTSGEIID